jgi:hypothetical protein
MTDQHHQPYDSAGNKYGELKPTPGATLGPTEYHPAADSAMAWLKGYIVQHPHEYLMHKEALASSALAGNRLAEICLSTMNRLAKSEPVSDRYLLGLAWTIMKLHNNDEMDLIESMRIDR